MQPILNTRNFPDLYSFLAGLAEEATNAKAINPNNKSVVIWSPENSATLLDSRDKLDLVAHYARKLDVQITLSASSDINLRNTAHEIGWNVLWSMPGLDQAAQRYLPHTVNEELEEALAS
jgi:hypothetical protein